MSIRFCWVCGRGLFIHKKGTGTITSYCEGCGIPYGKDITPRTFMHEESSYLSASIVKNFHIFTEKDKYEPLNSYLTAAKVINIFK